MLKLLNAIKFVGTDLQPIGECVVSCVLFVMLYNYLL